MSKDPKAKMTWALTLVTGVGDSAAGDIEQTPFHFGRTHDELVQSLFKDRSNDKKLQKVVEVINDSAILPDCERVVQDYSDKACQAIRALPDCEPKRSLIELAHYITARRR